MRQLHSCLIYMPKKRKALRMIEEPDELQAQIIKAFGGKVARWGLIDVKTVLRRKNKML